jgi:hypothetical protein
MKVSKSVESLEEVEKKVKDDDEKKEVKKAHDEAVQFQKKVCAHTHTHTQTIKLAGRKSDER